ncbi:MAG: YfiR family protein [Bacteroidales bacterium]
MKRKGLVISLILSTLIVVNISAQTSKLQVAYIYNFTNLVDWPSIDRAGNFIIGVFGQDQTIVKEFTALAQTRKIQGQNIEIKEFNDVSKITKCHILFIPEKSVSNISAIESKISNYNTLLISDMPGSVSKGMAVSFIMKEGKLNFQLETRNAEKYGLKVSSNLENLALK